MNDGPWESVVRPAAEALRGSPAYRTRRVIEPVDAAHIRFDGRVYVNFASNNYLGLTHHPRVIEAAVACLHRQGGGTGASALISGYGPSHESLERQIAQWKRTDAAVLLASGYQANHAAVQTLVAGARAARREIRFLLDKLCHASLIDAVRASDTPFRVFPHNRLDRLGRFLETTDSQTIQAVITESIFSMDGDAADLAGLVKLKRERPFVLLLDEAHASGVYGPGGGGLAAELGLSDAIDVTVATLSKSVGCIGGAVCGTRLFCEMLVNSARAYIYSTSIPPATAAAAHASLTVMRDEPERQERVRALARRVRQELIAAGVDLPSGDSPIIPIILGSEAAALEAAEALMSRAILTLAIRPPSVPPGTSRLRVTLSNAHSDEDIARLIDALRQTIGRCESTRVGTSLRNGELRRSGRSTN